MTDSSNMTARPTFEGALRSIGDASLAAELKGGDDVDALVEGIRREFPQDSTAEISRTYK